MASNYSFKAAVSGAELSILAAQTFLEPSERSYREDEQGRWDAPPTLVPKRVYSR